MSLGINALQNYFMSNIEDYGANNRQKMLKEFECVEKNPYPNNDKIIQEMDIAVINFSLNEKAFISNNNAEENKNEQYYTREITKTKEPIFSIKKSKKIFSIKKERKISTKKGRRHLNKFFASKAKHNKNSGDNITTKVKRQFINRTFNYINKKYKEYLSKNKLKKHILLKRIDPTIYNNSSKKNNQEFLGLYLYQLFSVDISDKYSNFIKSHSKRYNKEQIESLIKKNKAKEVIDILNLTVKEMYEKYINNVIEDFCLEKDLIEIEEKEGTEYKNKYKAKAEKFLY